jgi:catechol 2,3-dioxygenase-like lactoylglutathione lyase family enzyme
LVERASIIKGRRKRRPFSLFASGWREPLPGCRVPRLGPAAEVFMLKDKSSSAIVAVSDIDRARRFYRDTLGLDLVEDGMEDVLVFRTGETRLVVYRSKEAGTNRANAVVWDVGDEVEGIVSTLRGKGVTFEHYPEIGEFVDNAIHRAAKMKLVWFKDPDGNILHLNNM